MISAKQAVCALATILLAQSVAADFRFGASPKNNFKVDNQNGAIKFTTPTAVYDEPGTFGYQGLVNQRNNNYDNFLRSNVDNEQDNRNFNTEPGQDMLPFRTLNSAIDGAAVTYAIGSQQTVPVRWNNPHSSECEVNIWVANNSVVVPIKKPVCCGEGYQDGVITFKIPADFNQIKQYVPGFTGCNKVGDCTLQVYAHSVEPRIYAVGTPLILTGGDDLTKIPAATGTTFIAPYTDDPGMDISKQPRAICLPADAPESDITPSRPRFARQVSDVWNHAYQNSDYSPYSGQQQESISQNLQASSVIRMVATNGGELGQSLLTQDQKNARQNLANKINNVVQKYENAANNIINRYGGNQLKSAAKVIGNQQIASCALCAQSGSVNTNRQQTTTYIPSFKVPATLVAEVKNGLGNNLKSLVDADNNVGIYRAAFEEVRTDLINAARQGMSYQPARIKASTVTTTMADATRFRKLNAAGQQDGGKYAATQALNALKAEPQRSPNPYNTIAVGFAVKPSPSPSAAPSSSPAPSPVVIPNYVPPAAGSLGETSSGLPANPDDTQAPMTDADDSADSDDGSDDTAYESAAASLNPTTLLTLTVAGFSYVLYN